jgi:hypothetical protein
MSLEQNMWGRIAMRPLGKVVHAAQRMISNPKRNLHYFSKDDSIGMKKYISAHVTGRL